MNLCLGGKENHKVGRSYNAKKKAVVELELTEDGKVKRMYANQINIFSAKELHRMLDKHISKTTNINTLWLGDRPIAKEYNTQQIPSNSGKNVKIIHTLIHQIKSWIGATYSYLGAVHISGCFGEFCYRLNKSRNDTFFVEDLGRYFFATITT